MDRSVTVTFFYRVPGRDERLTLHLGAFDTVSVTPVHVLGFKDGRRYVLAVYEYGLGWRVYENDLIGRYYVRSQGNLDIVPDYQGGYDYAEAFNVNP